MSACAPARGAPANVRVEATAPIASAGTVSWEAPEREAGVYGVLVNGVKVGQVPAGGPGSRLECILSIQVHAVSNERASLTPVDAPDAPTAVRAGLLEARAADSGQAPPTHRDVLCGGLTTGEVQAPSNLDEGVAQAAAAGSPAAADSEDGLSREEHLELMRAYKFPTDPNIDWDMIQRLEARLPPPPKFTNNENDFNALMEVFARMDDRYRRKDENC